MMSKFSRMRTSAFTLLELMIVIGLMAGLVAVLLPSYRGARHDVMHSVCDYNAASTVRLLIQYRDLYNQLPDGMHTGIDVEGLDAEPANADALMDLPSPMVNNFMLNGGSFKNLTEANLHSLNRVGINYLASQSGYNLVDVSGGVRNSSDESNIWVAEVTDAWQDGGSDITFRGRQPSDYTDGGDDEAIIVLFITPTMNWESGRAIDDWTMGEMELRVDLEGQCPVPVDSAFRYYAAFVKVYGHDSSCGGRTRAEVIAVACPECEVLNP